VLGPAEPHIHVSAHHGHVGVSSSGPQSLRKAWTAPSISVRLCPFRITKRVWYRSVSNVALDVQGAKRVNRRCWSEGQLRHQRLRCAGRRWAWPCRHSVRRDVAQVRLDVWTSRLDPRGTEARAPAGLWTQHTSLTRTGQDHGW
jgi:hypothetical protein